MDDFDFARLVRGLRHLSYDEIVRHPRMPDARRLYLDRFLALYDRDAFMARLVSEASRFLVYYVAVVLGAAQDPALRETWLTVGRLKRELAMFELVSNRHIDQLIARLCTVGFMTSAPAAADGRVRILRPTEKMLARDRAWLAAHYAPLAVICPDGGYGLAMQEDATYQIAHRRAVVPFLPYFGKRFSFAPDLMSFFNRAAGYMISAALLQAAMAAPDQHAAVPYADIGERFGVSRTHVRDLLIAAQDIGLVRLEGRGGHRVEILPRLWTSYDRGMAAGMVFHDAVHAAVSGRSTHEKDREEDGEAEPAL